jgi:integrase
MSRSNTALRIVGPETCTYRSAAGRTITHTFDNGDLAARWIDACQNAEQRGLPVPSPHTFTVRRAAVPAIAPVSSNLTDICWAWFDDTFRAERNASPERRQQASAALRLHIIPQLGDLDVNAVRAADIDAFVDHLAGSRTGRPQPAPPPPSGSKLLPLATVARRTGQHQSRLRRLCREGHLPSTMRDGRLHLPVEVLQSPALLPADVRPAGLRRSTAVEILAVLRQIFEFAIKHRLTNINPAAAAQARTPLPRDARTKPDTIRPKVVQLADCVRICAHLHPLHQMAFWLQRSTGLRIGEAYGLRLKDVIFDGSYAVLRVEGMGGRNRAVRNPDTDEITTSRRKDTVKSDRGHRTILTAGPLRDLLATFIDIHHHDHDPDAPLIPGIRAFDRPSMGAFSSALKAALVAEELTAHHINYQITPKTLRASFGGEAKAYELCAGATLSQIMGHAPPLDTGESQITRSFYSPQLPGLSKLREAADAMSAHLAEHVDTLIIPTMKTQPFPRAHPLAVNGRALEARYHEHGWRTSNHGLLTLNEVSALTGLSLNAVRKRVNAAGITVTVRPGPNNVLTRHVPADSVETIAETGRRNAHRSRGAWTLTGVSAETGMSSNGLLKRIHRGTLEATFEPVAGVWLIPDAAVKRLKAEAAELKRLHQAGISFTDAAAESKMTFSALNHAIATGTLKVLPARDRCGHRYIDRRSFETFLQRHAKTRTKTSPGKDWIPVAEAAKRIGTTGKAVLNLVDVGLLGRRDHCGTKYVRVADLQRIYPDIFSRVTVPPGGVTRGHQRGR